MPLYRDSETRVPNFNGIPPLDLPNVASIDWYWHTAESRSNHTAGLHAVQYLAKCRFHQTCQFDITFDGVDTNELASLNPLFLPVTVGLSF